MEPAPALLRGAAIPNTSTVKRVPAAMDRGKADTYSFLLPKFSQKMTTPLTIQASVGDPTLYEYLTGNVMNIDEYCVRPVLARVIAKTK